MINLHKAPWPNKSIQKARDLLSAYTNVDILSDDEIIELYRDRYL